MRNWLSACFVGTTGLLLQGCAAGLVQENWLAATTHAPLPPFHIEISDAALSHACGDAPALRYYGCAVRLPEDRVCIIYTTPNPAAWVMVHERRHCAGWDHD